MASFCVSFAFVRVFSGSTELLVEVREEILAKLSEPKAAEVVVIETHKAS